jgi:hypothetical protein
MPLIYPFLSKILEKLGSFQNPITIQNNHLNNHANNHANVGEKRRLPGDRRRANRRSDASMRAAGTQRWVGSRDGCARMFTRESRCASHAWLEKVDPGQRFDFKRGDGQRFDFTSCPGKDLISKEVKSNLCPEV